MRLLKLLLIVSMIAALIGVTFPAQAQGTDTKAMKALMQRYGEEFYNQRKLDLGDQIFTPDVVLHQPGSPDSVGLKAYVQNYQNLINDWPDGKIASLVVASGEYAAGIYYWEATFAKPILSPAGELKPTGKKVAFNGILLAHFKGGKIGEVWKVWDAWNVFQQMGAVPAQGELPAIKPWDVKLGESKLTPKETTAIVERGFKDWPRIILVGDVTDDYAIHLPPSQAQLPPGITGHMLWTKVMLNTFPDLVLRGPGGKPQYNIVAEGDLAVVQYEIVFKFTKDFPPLTANDAVITVPGLSLLRLKGGQQAEFWVNWDTVSMMTQMMAPKAKK